MNLLLEQANNILKNQSFEYAFCGGYAIDLFLGKITRNHGDIDVHAYWNDRNTIILYMQSLGFQVYEMLGEGKAHHIVDINDQRMIKRNIFCIKEDCELVDLKETEEINVFDIQFHHIGQSKLNFIEFLFNDKTSIEFIYARNKDIKRNLNEAILYSNGIPYLSPEICLLYKSTDIERDGYQQDFELAITKMILNQKKWLKNALEVQFPNGHKWIVHCK